MRVFWEVMGCLFIGLGVFFAVRGASLAIRHAGWLIWARKRRAQLPVVLRRQLPRDLFEFAFAVFFLLFGLSQQAGGQIPERARSATCGAFFLLWLVFTGQRMRRVWQQVTAAMASELQAGQHVEIPSRVHDEIIPGFVIDTLDFFARRKMRRLQERRKQG